MKRSRKAPAAVDQRSLRAWPVDGPALSDAIQSCLLSLACSFTLAPLLNFLDGFKRRFRLEPDDRPERNSEVVVSAVVEVDLVSNVEPQAHGPDKALDAAAWI